MADQLILWPGQLWQCADDNASYAVMLLRCPDVWRYPEVWSCMHVWCSGSGGAHHQPGVINDLSLSSDLAEVHGYAWRLISDVGDDDQHDT